MSCFPETSGSRLLNLEDATENLPIIGWFHAGTGPQVLPLVLGRLGPLVAGDAVLAESGRVLDLTTGEFFDDELSWRETMSSADTYRAGHPYSALSFAPDRAAATPVTNNVSTPRTGTPVRAVAAPAAATGVLQLVFDGKLYSKQSFWQVPEDNPVVVFTLEQDAQAPKKGAKKITRDQYTILRKSLVEVTSAQMAEGIAPAAPGDDEPELPMGQDPAGEAPEDDADDMI